METIIEKLPNGNKIKYKVVNGTAYHAETPDEIVNVLERARANNERIILDYGDIKTGESWGDVHDVAGRIGRSTGNIKIPILLHNSRSIGGGAILDHCIIKILSSKGKRVLYKHPKL